MQTIRRFPAFLALAAALAPIAFPADARAQADDELVAAIREAAAREFGQSRIASSYGTIVSFAVNPDIAAARFYPEESEGVYGVELKASRIPYRYVFSPERDGARPFLQGVLAYQTLDAGLTVTPDDVIESEWRTIGGALTGGMVIPVGEHLDLLPGINVGVGRLDNTASYRGQIATEILRPALRELVFDWETDSLVYGLVLGADYRGSIGDRRFELVGSLSHHWLRSFNESNEFVEFETTSTTADLEFNAVLSSGLAVGKYPISIVGLLGATGFFGPQRDALGFTEFYEAGLALEADISAHGWSIESLRFGAKVIYGSNVSGWSLIVGRGFD